MGKTKKIKASDVTAAPKQSSIILATYKPLPRLRGCINCK